MPKKLSTSTKASSRYNNDCSAKGIVSNFNKIRKGYQAYLNRLKHLRLCYY